MLWAHVAVNNKMCPFPGVYMDREALSRRYSDGHHQVGWG